MEFNKEKFAKRLKEIRLSKKMTQDELSVKTGIEPPNYSNIERGKTTPTLQSLSKILTNLEVSPDEIFEYNHFEDEKTLDELNLKIYNSFSFETKQSLYKILRALEELKH